MSKSYFKVNKGISLVPQSIAPSTAQNGDMYYDAALNKFQIYQNGAWSDLSGGGTVGNIDGGTPSTDYVADSYDGGTP